MKDGTRSGLWSEMCRSIGELRPGYVVIENVRGLLSAEGEPPTDDMIALGERARNLCNAANLVERKLRRATNEGNDRYAAFHRRDAVRLIRARDRAVATERRERRTLVRAIGTVVGDLADIGYDAQWCGLRAADVGAPHGRFRVFILASPPDADSERYERRGRARDGWTDRMKAKHGNGNGHGASLAIEAQRLLPTPTASDANSSGSHGYGDQEFCTLTDATVRLPDRWGDYAPAVTRWETLTRPAPVPTEPTGKGGAYRLSPKFVEWMQGLPDGWITDTPGITRNEALKACGNGVVPQQAAAAIEYLLTMEGQQL